MENLKRKREQLDDFSNNLSVRVDDVYRDRLNVVLRKKRARERFIRKSDFLKVLINPGSDGLLTEADRYFLRTGAHRTGKSASWLERLAELPDAFLGMPAEDQEELVGRIDNLVKEFQKRGQKTGVVANSTKSAR